MPCVTSKRIRSMSFGIDRSLSTMTASPPSFLSSLQPSAATEAMSANANTRAEHLLEARRASGPKLRRLKSESHKVDTKHHYHAPPGLSPLAPVTLAVRRPPPLAAEADAIFAAVAAACAT